MTHSAGHRVEQDEAGIVTCRPAPLDEVRPTPELVAERVSESSVETVCDAMASSYRYKQ
jgi:hypothetical protein